MTLEEFMDKIYKIYEEKGCDGDVPVTVSTYSCGVTSERPLVESDIDDSGDGIVIRAEDN